MPLQCICAYNRIGRTQLGNYLFFGYRSERNVYAIIFSRDQSSDKLINFLDSQLDTRDSRLDPRDSRLDTQNYRGSRIEARGTVNLLLSGTVHLEVSDAVGHRSKEKWQSKNVRIDVRNIIAKEIAAINGTEDENQEISLPGYK